MTKLDWALKLAALGFRVFPLAENSKVPIKGFKDFSTNATTDKAQIEKWFKGRDRNIGISTDEFLVLDVDMKDAEKNGFKSLQGKELPVTASQKTPTEGHHFIFRADKPFKNSVAKLGPGLDTRAMGGYIVGAGSTINGGVYEFLERPIVAPPQWLIDACEAAPERKEAKEDKKVVVVDKERAMKRALEYLATVDAVSGERNHAGYKVANKLKDFGLDKGDIFFAMTEHWECNPPLELDEVKHVIDSAFYYGNDGQGSDSPEALFDPVPQPKSSAEEAVETLNKDHAFVMSGGSHHILFETKNSRGNFELEHINELSFHQKFASNTIQVDSSVQRLTKYWMTHKKRRSYDGIVFDPSMKSGDKYYNLWRGFQIKPLTDDEPVTDEMKKSVELFKQHLFENVCDGDLSDYNWVMGWFAHMVQKPWEKPETALVLRGAKGVGKNVIFDVMKTFTPDHFLLASSMRYMTGNFNNHLEKLLLFVLDEAFWSGEKSADGTLKHLVTGKDLQIERKGVDSYSVESFVRVAILGNEKWLVPASQDERRYAVFDVKSHKRTNRDFFGSMMNGMAKGANRLLFTELQNFDLSQVDVFTIPQTEGLLNQKHSTLNPVERFWFDCLYQGFVPGLSFNEEGEWDINVDKNQFVSAFMTYVRSRGLKFWLPTDKELMGMFNDMIPGMKLERNSPIKILFPDLESCRAGWDTYQGQKTKWDL